MCNSVQEYGFCSYSYGFISLFKLLLYFTLILNQVKHYKSEVLLTVQISIFISVIN